MDPDSFVEDSSVEDYSINEAKQITKKDLKEGKSQDLLSQLKQLRDLVIEIEATDWMFN
jgi:hypothetical protein